MCTPPPHEWHAGLGSEVTRCNPPSCLPAPRPACSPSLQWSWCMQYCAQRGASGQAFGCRESANSCWQVALGSRTMFFGVGSPSSDCRLTAIVRNNTQGMADICGSGMQGGPARCFGGLLLLHVKSLVQSPPHPKPAAGCEHATEDWHIFGCRQQLCPDVPPGVAILPPNRQSLCEACRRHRGRDAKGQKQHLCAEGQVSHSHRPKLKLHIATVCGQTL